MKKRYNSSSTDVDKERIEIAKAFWQKHQNRYANERDKIVSFLVPAVSEEKGEKKMQALDVGCGRGVLTKMLCEKGYNSFGIDIDEERIEYAQKHFSTGGLSFQIQDATKLEFPDRSFDLVLCLEVIEHLRNPQELLPEIRRVIKSEGMLVISTPNRLSPEGLAARAFCRIRGLKWYAWDETHQRVFSASEFLQLLNSNGFKPTRTVGYYCFPSFHYFESIQFLNRLQEMFDFVRYAHFTQPLLNRVGFDIICACVPRQRTRE